jgi:hypothetical protein
MPKPSPSLVWQETSAMCLTFPGFCRKPCADELSFASKHWTYRQRLNCFGMQYFGRGLIDKRCSISLTLLSTKALRRELDSVAFYY